MTRNGAEHPQQPRRCPYRGGVMPPSRPRTAKRCSWLCTIRAAGGVDPPGVRRCPTCDTVLDLTRHANRVYCSLECRERMAWRRVAERDH